MRRSRPLEDWGKLLGDVPSATAILDRFLHHAEIIKITRQELPAAPPCGETAGRVDEAKAAKAPTGSEELVGTSKAAKAPPSSGDGPESSKAAKAPMAGQEQTDKAASADGQASR